MTARKRKVRAVKASALVGPTANEDRIALYIRDKSLEELGYEDYDPVMVVPRAEWLELQRAKREERRLRGVLAELPRRQEDKPIAFTRGEEALK